MRYILLVFFGVFAYGAYCQETQVQYLSGTDAENTVPWAFYCSEGMNSKKWTSIEVPSCWEQQGFGAYNYGLVPFDDRLKETGMYKHTFRVPQDWKSKQINIVFDGVMTDAEVKINGESVGIHQGAFYQFDFDITDLLRFDSENTLEVLVKKFSDNESVNFAERKADYWIFGGIFRPVYLEAKPKVNILRVAVNAQADGTFDADVYTSLLAEPHLMEVNIQTLNGTVIKTLNTQINGSKSRISGYIDNPELWNQESPFLYNAVFTLKSGNKVIHEYREKFGFRTVQVKAHDGIYINGTKIKLKGVNRHTFHPDYGRTSSKNLSIEAVYLMKEMNMNAVRMSHYPPEKHFLEVCDSLGMYVLNELAGWQAPSYDDEVGLKLLKEMIERDVNHPSIIIWDNGNEGGWNRTLDDDFAKLDIQKREVIHPWQNYGKFNTRHYIDYNYLSLDNYGKREIFMPTEFLHGLYDGGHGAGLEDYWLRMWQDPLCAGGFLWVFADEGVSRTDRNGAIDFDLNHAPDGILGPYMQKEASFYQIKKIWSPIFFEKRYIKADFDGVFNLENRYHFTNLNQGAFYVQWINYDQNGVENITSEEKIKVDLVPNQRGKLTINLPENWIKNQVVRITANDKNDHEINKWSYAIESAHHSFNKTRPDYQRSDVLLTEYNEEYQVQAGDLTCKFEKTKGLLSSVEFGGEYIPLSNGPLFVSAEKKVRKVSANTEQDGSVTILTVFENEADSIIWNINQDGLVHLKAFYQPLGNAPYAGITFSFPENRVSSMKWMGQGPYRVWKNRMQYTNFGVWAKEYNNTITGFSDYDYPEFKGYHADMYWAEIKGKNNLGFKVYAKSNDVFLRLLTPEKPENEANTTLDFPPGDISFLQGINAIGTKFKPAQRLGPQSSNYVFRPNHFYNKKLMIDLVFDFRFFGENGK